MGEREEVVSRLGHLRFELTCPAPVKDTTYRVRVTGDNILLD